MTLTFNSNAFEQAASPFVETYKIPGASLGLNHNSKPLYYKGFGYRDKTEKLPLDADTVFGIASMTKSFACVAIMHLQDAGKLSVDDQVIKHVPEFKLPSDGKTEKVSLHHLMTHTTGLPPISVHNLARKRSIDNDPTAKDYGLDVTKMVGDPIDTDVQLMEKIASLPVEVLDDPGKAFSYSNEAYGVLGAVVNRASGVSFETYVIENILKPANLNNTFFDIAEIEKRDNVTMLYAQKKEADKKIVYDTPLWWDAPAMRAAGYLKSTVNDILTYLEIFRNKGVVGGIRILSEESVEQMTYPHVEFEPGRYYGYGLRVVPDFFGYKLIEHSGGLKGVSSHMTVIPELGVTGALLTNLSSIPAAKLLRGALNVLLEKGFDASSFTYMDYVMSEEKQETCVGTYTSTEGMKVEISFEKGKLGIVSEAKFSPLRCVGDFTFISEQGDVIRFFANEQGEAERIYYGSRQIAKDK
ncbi:serine hydrolase domain-containing protein [Ornithinibacillus sp. 4-3]|uniref:Serine hydrolase domain-containing protein n=1 Tax=Ornithinibacillus sp. 4-3 TaxID=3231488 RepID=A0AB39HTL9_9BACI